jgi:RhtB (resistance to homoserine/threonine) family protein
MFDATQILGFLAAVLVLVLVPGPNTMLILAHSVAGGRAAGLATVLGVEVGTVVHTLAAAFGLSAILATSALAFDVLKYAGAAYLVYVGLSELRRGRAAAGDAVHDAPDLPLHAFFRRAVLGNVVNPKVALFFLAFLPQFVRPERGHVVLQFAVLGLIVSAVGLCFGSLLALAAGAVSGWLRREVVARWQHRLTGSVLLGLGLRLAVVRPQ